MERPRDAQRTAHEHALQIGAPTRSEHIADDGTRLVVRRWPGGEGPTIVLCDGLGCDGYIWPYVLSRLVHERPFFHMHWRGHGESAVPRDLDSIRLTQIVDDLQRALDAHGIDDVIVLGHSMGVPIALECWRAFGARIRALGLLCGVFENPIATWHGAPARHLPRTVDNLVMNAAFDRFTRTVIDRWSRFQSGWSRLMTTEFAYRAAVAGELNPTLIREEDFRPYLRHLETMDMRVFARLARDMREHSARDVLPTIDVPTLIVGGARDKFAPPWISEEMHRCIGGSELLMLAEGSHCAPIEQPRLVERALLRLLARATSRAR